MSDDQAKKDVPLFDLSEFSWGDYEKFTYALNKMIAPKNADDAMEAIRSFRETLARVTRYVPAEWFVGSATEPDYGDAETYLQLKAQRVSDLREAFQAALTAKN